jgi:hypothetical protein
MTPSAPPISASARAPRRVAPRSIASLLAALSAALGAACGDNLTVPPDRDPASDPDPPVLGCVPNLDASIERAELAPTLDVVARYVVSPSGTERTVDLEGAQGEEGLVWDFATDYADDERLELAATALAGKWYEDAFESGAFVTAFDRSGRLESVAVAREDGLYLLGIASSEAAPAEGTTLLVYDPPIALLRYPVEVGQKFVSSGSITDGTVRGLPYAGRDTYEVEVDAMGSIDLPQLTFAEVHRVRTKVTVEPSVGAPVVRQQISFFAECFGEVARVTSRDGESNPNFTEAAELRRFGY